MEFFSVLEWPEGTSLGRVDRKSLDSHGDHSRSEAGARSVVSTLKAQGMGCEGAIFPVDGYVIRGFSDGDLVKAEGKDIADYHCLLTLQGNDIYLVNGKGINYILDHLNIVDGVYKVLDTDITLKYVSDSTLNICS